MADDTQQQQAPLNINDALQALIRQQLAAASGQQQVQLPSLPTPQVQTQYSNDPEKGPDLLQRIGLALGGGAMPGAPAELRAQMGSQGLLNFGIGLMSGGKFATPGEVLAGGLRGAQAGLLGNEAALAGQQEYALNAQTKMAELAAQQQKNRTEALTALVPLLQMRERLGLPPLFGPGSAAGPPGGGGGGGGGDTSTAGDGSYPTDQKPGWSYLAQLSPDMQKMVQTAAAQTGMPVELLAAHKWNESRNASSVKPNLQDPGGGSFGIMQMGQGALDDYNAKHNTKYTLQDINNDPQLALNVGAGHWTDLRQQYGGNSFLASMAYARGPGATNAWIKGGSKYADLPPGVQRVLGNVYGPGSFPGATPIPEALALNQRGGQGAQPPATAPGSAVGPYKVAGTGNVPPPTTQPSSGSGGAASPFGTGAFAPPTTTVAAPPDTTANAPNTGTALPVPTPAMTAALAEAKRTGKPAVIEGSGGATVGPDGKFSGNVTTGRRADADAILQGVQTAQTTLPPADTVATAGPGAGGGGTPPAAQPAPDSAFGGGAFATAPPRFVGPVTAPAAPAQPPAPQPPAAPAQPAQPPASPAAPPPARAPDLTARNDDGSFVVPNDKLSLPDYQQRFRHVPTADELTQRGLVIPGNEAEAQAAARGVQEAEAAAQAAQTAANRAQAGYTGYGTVADLLKANTEAQAKAQDARQKYAEMLQDTTKTNAAALQKYYEKQDTDLAANYKAEVLEPRNAAALETQRGETQKDIERIKTGADLQRTLMQPDLDRLKAMGTQSDEMTNLAVNLQQLRAVLPNLPEAGWGAAIAQHLSPAAMGWMQAAGLGDPKQMNAVQALNGLAAYLSVQMRPTGSGALRNQEMDRFMQALPNLAQGAAGREKAVAFLLNYANRVQDENQFANEYFHRPKADGSPALNLIGVERAMNAPKSQGGLGEVVPHAPPLSAGPQAAQTFLSGIDSGRPYYAWVPKVDKSGTPIRNERGQVVYDYDLAVKP